MKTLTRGWKSFLTGDYLTDENEVACQTCNADLREILPPTLVLTDFDRFLIEQVETTGQMSDMSGYIDAVRKRGPSNDAILAARTSVIEISSFLSARNIELPDHFFRLFFHEEFFVRFRVGQFGDAPFLETNTFQSHSFPDMHFVSFMQNTHFPCFWYLVIDVESSFVACGDETCDEMLRNGLSIDGANIFQCASSFTEFLLRACQETISYEDELAQLT